MTRALSGLLAGVRELCRFGRRNRRIGLDPSGLSDHALRDIGLASDAVKTRPRARLHLHL